MGTYIANRVSDKIVQLLEHIYAYRFGSSADTQALTDYVKFYLQQLLYVVHDDSVMMAALLF